jgi:myo-inositol 2-dehydrogenase / D-chiro-inositol 1-dehydrogenase
MRKPATEAGVDRRDFLAASTTGAIALGVSSFPSGVHAAGTDTIKIGMIGSGDRCTGAAVQALKAGHDVKLVAMCDIFRDRLDFSRNYLKSELPDQVKVQDDHCFVGFDAYKHVIDSSDVVLIACASKFHPMYAEAAIRAGKHVFVEKPHGIDPVGVRRMEAACALAKAKNLSILSGLQSRWHSGWQETVKRIHDGAIGDVVAIQAMFLRGPYRLNPRESSLSETAYQFRNWYHFCWLSGDDVTQSLVHNMDRAAWVLKEETPQWCFGLAGRSASFGDIFGDMFDHHTVVYEYASGARVYALCRTQEQCYGNSSDVIMGTKGTCHLGKCRIDGKTPWKFKGPQNDPYLAEQKALIDSVRTGKPINSGLHMNNSTLAGVMGQMACYTGAPVTWDEARRSALQYGPSPEASNFETRPPSLPDKTGNYPLPRPGVTRLDGKA